MFVEPKFRVAICGGGIAGLTLACALSDSPDIQVEVYEAATQFAEIGAGVGLWWRTHQVLRTLGLEEDIAKIGCPFSETRIPTIHYRKSDQMIANNFFVVESRGGLVTLHRADFQAILLRRVQNTPNCTTHNSKRLVSYTSPSSEDEPIRVLFQDGTTTECDVLVDGDGVKSAARATMFEEIAKDAKDEAEAAQLRDFAVASYTGVTSYRTVIPSEKLRNLSPNHPALSSSNQFLGKNRHLMAYPASQGRLINVAIFDVNYADENTVLPEPWVSEADPRQIMTLFEDWEEDVRHIMKCVGANPVKRWSVNVVKPLPSFVYGRVAIMGDAAHSMPPFLGSGAGQAIEDAYTLSTLLSHRLTTKANLMRVLEIYSHIRVPIATVFSELSRKNGRYFVLHKHATDAEGLQELGKKMQRGFDYCTDTDPLADVESGVKMLEAEFGAA